MRRLHLAGDRRRSRRGADGPPPVGRRRRPDAAAAVRPAGDAAPAAPAGLPRVERGPAPQRGVAHAVGAAPARRRNSTRRSTGRPSPPAARPATATPRPGWPTASACSSTSTWPARSTSTTCCAARCRAAPSATGSTRPRAGQGLIAESVVVVAAFAFEQLDLHRLEICIVPRNRNSRRVMEKLGIREEGVARAVPRDQRGLGGPRPLWLHRRGVGRTPRRTAAAWLALIARCRRRLTADQELRGLASARRIASALAWRLAVRRFHIFSFQWRLRALRRACPWRPRGPGGGRLPGAAGLVHVDGSRPALTWLATSCSSTWIRCRSPWA